MKSIENAYKMVNRNKDKKSTKKMRREKLIALGENILKNSDKLYDAFMKDLNKSKTEVYMTEIAPVLSEIKSIKRNMKILKPKRVIPKLSQFPSSIWIKREAYGRVLIVTPWNYPLFLSLIPVIGAYACGNSILLKLSDYAPNVAKVIENILKDTFYDEISVVIGGREENEALFKLKFDYIFFTGSPTLGKVFMREASKNLTPITLELGGKSPVIVDSTADLLKTAKRICFGKLINAGQTCVAPDYILADEKIVDNLLLNIKEEIKRAIPDYEYFKDTFGKIINEKHFNRLYELVRDEEIEKIEDRVHVDDFFYEDLEKIYPIIVKDPKKDSKLMESEIFGPILPIISYRDDNSLIEYLREKDHPLSMYIFSNDKNFIKKIENSIKSGGLAINDTIIHMAASNVPFGGVGNSGMGSYHGKWSIKTFTRERTILKKWWILDFNMRYQPYTREKLKKLKRFLGKRQ